MGMLDTVKNWLRQIAEVGLLVIAAAGKTFTMLVSRARRAINSISAIWSITGSVLGIHTTLVIPPAEAAALAVARVSLCSAPGSRR